MIGKLNHVGVATPSIAEAIELISDVMTLEPGDVIAMGTPAGVGFAQTPPAWLKAGDEIVVEIEGIGAQRIRIAPAA